ncbi:endonuclease/exonuclease/phosphatase family protein [Rheinheimera baltica]|uniref:endonuclease/exonuclease/phosphatase family protein n=1 Tax=Rheinheimera baltica TaxID=67576 RepID=UPI0027400D9C|nr:endonuclease/exonuclease/phosphatase family protein [Rheinheimera baltica]MDP5190508.1 endonuclease/exonuclease/phosphatase family protein [Rheinheimera baltica]
MSNRLWQSMFWLRILTLLFALLLATVSYWPQWQWLQWLSLLVLYSPSWLYLVLILPWLFGWASLTRWQSLMLAPIFFVSVKMLDVSLYVSRDTQDANFVLLSANLGNITDTKQLASLLIQHNVSVALFQEAKPAMLVAIDDLGWQSHCEAGLCIASRLPFTLEQTISRALFQGYGNFVAFYRVRLAERDLMLANVHFETPRPALESLITLNPNSKTMLQKQSDRALQATIVSEWAKASTTPLIIGGDFNMPTLSPIYQQYLSDFGNALSEKPSQMFSYTKYTRWHGIRIDHQLYRGHAMPLSAQVLALPGADHRPVLVKWRI